MTKTELKAEVQRLAADVRPMLRKLAGQVECSTCRDRGYLYVYPGGPHADLRIDQVTSPTRCDDGWSFCNCAKGQLLREEKYAANREGIRSGVLAVPGTFTGKFR